MVQTIEELHNAIKNEHLIKKEITDTLIELDTTPSMGTQAYLNGLVVDLYKRVIDTEDDIILEALNDEVITGQQFIEWIDTNFTTYSAKLFRKSI